MEPAPPPDTVTHRRMRGILRVKGCAQTLLRCRLAGGHSHWWNHQGTPLSSSGSPVWPRFTRQSSLLLRGLPAPGPGGQEAWRPSSRWVSPSSWGRVCPQTLVALLVAQEESSGERPACRQGTGGADAGCQGGCGPVLRQPGPRSAARVSADVGTRFGSSTAGRLLCGPCTRVARTPGAKLRADRRRENRGSPCGSVARAKGPRLEDRGSCPPPHTS